ncbi:MAG: filamentous hemagglutinin N-terminal domain-containing protein [Cyanobacteria bacterium P01_F01_bin.143]
MFSTSVNAQVITDGTTNTTVDNNGTILNGDIAGTNLFHSFQEFSIPNGGRAFFETNSDIANIFSRVTGGEISTIDGLLGASGTANLFLLNPSGIIFGGNATLGIGGSFIGTSADSVQFSDGTVFSAIDMETQPILTIHAPIGLNFRDNPGNIVNQSFVTDDTGFDLIGLRVPANKTLALIGGNLSINGGFVSTIDGRIELGSVSANSTVSLRSIEQGFDVTYSEDTNFQDMSLSGAAFVNNFGTNPGDIEVQGKNISLTEGSIISIDANNSGQAGNLSVVASESLTLDGNGLEVNIGNFSTSLSNTISGGATGEGSQINISSPQLTINNGANIFANVSGEGQGVDIVIDAENIVVDTPFIVDIESGSFQPVGIFAQVGQNGFGDGGDITIETDRLTLNKGGQITTDTFGGGNAGNLTITATKSIEINGTINDSLATENIIDSDNPSGLFANVGNRATATGNGGNLTLTTPQLVVSDGAQIGTVARNTGNGGILTINTTESIFLTGTSPLAVLDGTGRSGIFANAGRSFRDPESGDIIPTTENGGSVKINSQILTIEKGAVISINTLSQGNGGNGNINVNRLIVREGGQIGAGSRIEANSLDPEGIRGNGGQLKINATEAIEITGIGDINNQQVNSSIFTEAQSTGNAGTLTLTTDNLTVSDGGEINTSATGTGAAGSLTIAANSLTLSGGTLTAETAAGTGGNINLDVSDRINLVNNSGISARATGTANGGNIDIDTTFIIASPNQNSDIVASADSEGIGGRITIEAEGIFGLEVRSQDALTNDIDASGGVDGEVRINTPDTDVTRGLSRTTQNIVQSEQITAQACSRDRASQRTASLIIKNKGGLPPDVTAPFFADPILSNEASTISKLQENYPNIEPIKTSIGDIYPARGIIKTADGKIILTAYPTEANMREFHVAANCGQI